MVTLILSAIIGFVVGRIAGWLADYLPRFSATPVSPMPPVPSVSSLLSIPWRLDPHDRWAVLRLGAALLSAVYFAYLSLQPGLAWNAVLYAGAYTFFLLIALIDLKYRLVLNILTYPAIAVILLVQVVFQQMPLINVLLGGGMAFAIFFLTFWLRPNDLGGGDIKLATLIGLMLGFPQVLWALIVGGGIGAVVAVILWRQHGESKRTMPYAPFLCLGVMVALLYNPIVLMMQGRP